VNSLKKWLNGCAETLLAIVKVTKEAAIERVLLKTWLSTYVIVNEHQDRPSALKIDGLGGSIVPSTDAQGGVSCSVRRKRGISTVLS